MGDFATRVPCAKVRSPPRKPRNGGPLLHPAAVDRSQECAGAASGTCWNRSSQQLVFRTQSTGEDGAIPDLDGLDPQGQAVLVLLPERENVEGVDHAVAEMQD